MYSFGGATLTPYPYSEFCCTTRQQDRHEYACLWKKVVGREEPENIWATQIAARRLQQSVALQVFYADEHTLRWHAMQKPPADLVNNPPLDAKRDGNNFLFPAVFITDLSANAGDTSGDAQAEALRTGYSWSMARGK